MARTSARFVPNPELYQQLSESGGFRDVLGDVSGQGADAARALAPEYAGPTYNPRVSRHGEYKDSIYSTVNMHDNGWRAEFGSTAPWWAQVEFGSGRPATSHNRPQGGHSPKTRTLGRALDSLRES